MEGRLKGKVALITAAGNGIGRAAALRYAAEGARVIATDIDAAALAGLDGCEQRALDVTDAAQIAALVDEVGRIDVLANIAGIVHAGTILDMSDAEWEQAVAINMTAMMRTIRAVLPGMLAAGGGAIVNFGSISWHLGLPELVLYQTAKAAIEGMTRSMARDLGRDNIRVTTIVPGNVQTPRQEKWYTPEGEAEIVAAQCLDGRIQPADVAALALFLASDDARMCTGHEYFVDAGWR